MEKTTGDRHSSLATLLGRALRRRCPNCGNAGIFDGWVRIRKACPACRIRLERTEEGYFTGAWMLNIIIAELALVAVLVLAAIVTWPGVPWDLITYGGGALMVVLPVVAFPFTRTIWLACDLAFRPAEPEDFSSASP